MKIGQREIAPGAQPFIIAELGVNHDGSSERAIQLTEAAHAAGADAIKLQFFRAEQLLSRAARLADYQRGAGAADPFQMLASLELSIEKMDDLVSRAHELGLAAIVTVFSVESVPQASTLAWDAYKTASPDIIHEPLLRALLKTGRPLLVSTGAATLEEVRRACEWLQDHPHVIMQCVSSYPTPDDQAALGGRIALARLTPRALGYSDHTVAVDTGALAVASGAVVLEKHLTYDRAATGPDHASSLDPNAFTEYVRLARRAWAMVGTVEKKVLDIEHDVRDVARQSLTAARRLPAGHVLAPGDVAIKRPGAGLPPWRLESIVGRRLLRVVEPDMPVHEEDLA